MKLFWVSDEFSHHLSYGLGFWYLCSDKNPSCNLALKQCNMHIFPCIKLKRLICIILVFQYINTVCHILTRFVQFDISFFSLKFHCRLVIHNKCELFLKTVFPKWFSNCVKWCYFNNIFSLLLFSSIVMTIMPIIY